VGVAPVEPVVPGICLETGDERESEDDERQCLKESPGVGVCHARTLECEERLGWWESESCLDDELCGVGKGDDKKGVL